MTKSGLYKFLKPILTILVKIIFRPKVVNADKITKSGRMVIAGNHTSIVDPVLLLSLTKRTIHFLAKIELISGPFGFCFKHLGIIPVDRSTKDKNVLPSSEKCLNNGEIVGVFPEGTTEKGRGLLPFKIGAIRMASDTDSYILPFAITGKYRLFNNKLAIVFGEPYKINDKENLDKENEILRTKVENLIKEGERYGQDK